MRADTMVLTPIFCVIEGLHRSRAVADDAVRGRFTHAGLTAELGRRPDWTNTGIADDEWRIEWVKLYEGLDLANAYVATGSSVYLQMWEGLVESFCDQVPVGVDSSDVSARRVQNWIYAWQRFGEHPEFEGLREGLADRIAERIRRDTDHLEHHLTPARNHRTLELYTVLLASIALGERDRAASALARLADNAADDIGPDGVHCERSTDYHGVVLRSFVGAIHNAELACLAVPDRLRDRAHAAATVAMHWQRPDGLTPAVSDGDIADFRPLLLLAADVLRREDLRFAATAGLHGTVPAERHATFATGGYAVQRSGWGCGARPFGDGWWALFDVGPLGDGGHGHYDHLSVELYANGHPLVVDPGRYTYEEEPVGWRRWFKGTAAHNTVTVDGLDQTPYRRGKPKGPVSSASLVGRATGTMLDTIVGETASPSYDARHTRVLTLIHGECWRITDLLRSPSAHRYELRWHLPADAQALVHVRSDTAGVVVATPHASFEFPGHTEVSIERGWVSPTYGVKHEAPVIVVSAGGCDVDFTTVVRPC